MNFFYIFLFLLQLCKGAKVRTPDLDCLKLQKESPELNIPCDEIDNDSNGYNWGSDAEEEQHSNDQTKEQISSSNSTSNDIKNLNSNEVKIPNQIQQAEQTISKSNSDAPSNDDIEKALAQLDMEMKTNQQKIDKINTQNSTSISKNPSNIPVNTNTQNQLTNTLKDAAIQESTPILNPQTSINLQQSTINDEPPRFEQKQSIIDENQIENNASFQQVKQQLEQNLFNLKQQQQEKSKALEQNMNSLSDQVTKINQNIVQSIEQSSLVGNQNKQSITDMQKLIDKLQQKIEEKQGPSGPQLKEIQSTQAELFQKMNKITDLLLEQQKQTQNAQSQIQALLQQKPMSILPIQPTGQPDIKNLLEILTKPQKEESNPSQLLQQLMTPQTQPVQNPQQTLLQLLGQEPPQPQSEADQMVELFQNMLNGQLPKKKKKKNKKKRFNQENFFKQLFSQDI